MRNISNVPLVVVDLVSKAGRVCHSELQPHSLLLNHCRTHTGQITHCSSAAPVCPHTGMQHLPYTQPHNSGRHSTATIYTYNGSELTQNHTAKPYHINVCAHVCHNSHAEIYPPNDPLNNKRYIHCRPHHPPWLTELTCVVFGISSCGGVQVLRLMRALNSVLISVDLPSPDSPAKEGGGSKDDGGNHHCVYCVRLCAGVCNKPRNTE